MEAAWSRWALALILAATVAVHVRGQCAYTERNRLDPSDPQGTALFGYALAQDGDRALVGAWKKGVFAAYSGAAYMLQWDGEGWQHVQRIVPTTGAQDDQFGYAVDVDDDVALVGARKEDAGSLDAGAAYVFRFDGTTWNQEARLVAPDGAAVDEFGTSVALYRGVAVVGAPFDDDNGDKSGAVYVFRDDGTTWTMTEKLLGSDTVGGDQFGNFLAFDGGVLVVSAPLDNDDGFDSGVVFVFRDQGSTFVEEQKVTAADASGADQFGSALAIDGARLLVGARRGDSTVADTGAAYVFEFDGATWRESAKLVAAGGVAGDEVGKAVALDGDVAVLGAPEAQGSVGYAVTFRREGPAWREEARYVASNPDPVDTFGCAVSVGDEQVLVGAWGDEQPYATDAGSVYTFLARPLDLVVRPRGAYPGSGMTAQLRGGAPGGLHTIALVEIDAVPTYLPLLYGTFNASCVQDYASTVPAGLNGIQVRVQGIGFAVDGALEVTGVETVDFL